MIFLQKLKRNPFLLYLIAMIWTIVLSIILLQPENQPIIPTGVQPAPPSLEREIFFSSLHIITFTLTAIIWCFALKPNLDSRGLLISFVITMLAYGLTVEYLQSTIPGRNAQWWDMLANCIGIACGLMLWLWYQSRNLRTIR